MGLNGNGKNAIQILKNTKKENNWIRIKRNMEFTGRDKVDKIGLVVFSTQKVVKAMRENETSQGELENERGR